MSSYSDDTTMEIICPFCGKIFVINTNQLGEMAICPNCNTIMTAEESLRSDSNPAIPKVQPK